MMQHDISGGPPDVANKQLIGAGKDNCKQNKHISKMNKLIIIHDNLVNFTCH